MHCGDDARRRATEQLAEKERSLRELVSWNQSLYGFVHEMAAGSPGK